MSQIKTSLNFDTRLDSTERYFSTDSQYAQGLRYDPSLVQLETPKGSLRHKVSGLKSASEICSNSEFNSNEAPQLWVRIDVLNSKLILPEDTPHLDDQKAWSCPISSLPPFEPLDRKDQPECNSESALLRKGNESISPCDDIHTLHRCSTNFASFSSTKPLLYQVKNVKNHKQADEILTEKQAGHDNRNFYLLDQQMQSNDCPRQVKSKQLNDVQFLSQIAPLEYRDWNKEQDLDGKESSLIKLKDMCTSRAKIFDELKDSMLQMTDCYENALVKSEESGNYMNSSSLQSYEDYIVSEEQDQPRHQGKYSKSPKLLEELKREKQNEILRKRMHNELGINVEIECLDTNRQENSLRGKSSTPNEKVKLEKFQKCTNSIRKSSKVKGELKCLLKRSEKIIKIQNQLQKEMCSKENLQQYNFQESISNLATCVRQAHPKLFTTLPNQEINESSHGGASESVKIRRSSGHGIEQDQLFNNQNMTLETMCDQNMMEFYLKKDSRFFFWESASTLFDETNFDHPVIAGLMSLKDAGNTIEPNSTTRADPQSSKHRLLNSFVHASSFESQIDETMFLCSHTSSQVGDSGQALQFISQQLGLEISPNLDQVTEVDYLLNILSQQKQVAASSRQQNVSQLVQQMEQVLTQEVSGYQAIEYIQDAERQGKLLLRRQRDAKNRRKLAKDKIAKEQQKIKSKRLTDFSLQNSSQQFEEINFTKVQEEQTKFSLNQKEII